MGKGFISPSHFFFEVLIMLIKDNHLLLDKSERVDSFINESVEISESESNVSEQFVPVIESKYSTEQYINIKDIKDLSENTGKPYYECIDNIISCNNLSNPVFIVNESDYIESDTIREMTKIISENSPVKSVQLSNSNPVYICANEAINSMAYDGDSSLLEAFMEDDFYPFNSVLEDAQVDENALKEKLEKEGKKAIFSLPKDQQKEALRIYKTTNRYKQDQDAKNQKEEEKKSQAAKFNQIAEKVKNMSPEEYEKLKPTLSEEDRQLYDKAIKQNQTSSYAVFDAGKVKNLSDEDYDKYFHNLSPEDRRKARELRDKVEEENKQKDQGDQKQTVQDQQQTTKDQNKETQQTTNQTQKNDDQKNQQQTTKDQNKETQQSQQQDQQKEKQVESTINNMEKEAENKPAGFISSKIAALRKLYQNWLAKKNQEHDQGKIGFFSNILRVITNCIDRLLVKLQGVKKAENDATNNSSAQQPNGNTQTAAKPATTNG